MYNLQPAPNNLAHRAPAHPPSTSSSSSYGDPESTPSYYDGASAAAGAATVAGGINRGKMHQHHHHHPPHPPSAFGVGGSTFGLPPSLDARTLDKLKDRAVAKARAVQSSLISAVKSGGGAGGSGFSSSSHGGFGVVPSPAATTTTSHHQQHYPPSPSSSSSTFSSLAAKLGRLCHRVESAKATALFCRACVASYFVHLVAEDVRAWKAVRPTSSASAANAALGAPRALAFPLVSTLVVLPSALSVVLGRFVAPAAALLALEMLWKSTRLLYIQFLLVFAHGRAPSELLAKKVAMVGVAALVAIHPVAGRDSNYDDDGDFGGKPKSGSSWSWRGRRQKRNANGGANGGADGGGDGGAASNVPSKSASFAGPPMLLDAAAAKLEAAGIGRSAVLLAGRLLICGLLLTGGLAQLRRVSARGWRPWRRWAAPSSVAFEDGHDNNFLLLELALAIPYALGWRVPEVTRMLAGTLFAEACVCWPIWRHWPNPHFAAHVRSHFFCNVGVASGLLLTRSFGGGVFAADKVIGRKKSH